MKIAVINSPERVKEHDLENLKMVLSKYTPIDSVTTIRGYDGLHNSSYLPGAITLYTVYKTKGIAILSPANYKVINELLDECDVLIIFPALDRTGLCENIINRWYRLHGYNNLEVL